MNELKKEAYVQTESILYNYRINISRLKELEIKLEEEEENYINCSSGYGVIGSHKVESSIENRITRIEDIKRRIKIAKNTIKRVDNALESLNDLKRKIIEGIYFKNKTGREMALELNLCEQSISNHKRAALKTITEIICSDK